MTINAIAIVSPNFRLLGKRGLLFLMALFVDQFAPPLRRRGMVFLR